MSIHLEYLYVFSRINQNFVLLPFVGSLPCGLSKWTCFIIGISRSSFNILSSRVAASDDPVACRHAVNCTDCFCSLMVANHSILIACKTSTSQPSSNSPASISKSLLCTPSVHVCKSAIAFR